MKTGAGPEINIPQPPEHKLNAMKTGAGPELNIPQPPEHKLNAMKTGASTDINIPQPLEHELNAMKTGAGPEINIPQPPEHVLNAWKTGAKSSLPQFRFESKTNENLKLDLPSHFYNRKFVNKTNMTPDKPSRFVYKTDYRFSEESFSLSCKMRDPLTFSIEPDSYKSQDKAKSIMAKIYCDEIIESKETDECRIKDKLSDHNIILSVNEGDENDFELINDTKRQVKICSEEPIQSKSSSQINKPKSMLDKVDTLVFQEKDDTTQIKGLPKNNFKPQTTNQFLDKSTSDPKKIPEFLFPDSQYSKIINLNNEKLIHINNKRKLSMIMLQYKQIFEAKSFNSKGDSFGQQNGGGSKSKCNEHENHPSCKKTHVSEMVYSGEKINYSGLNNAEQNEGHIYSTLKSKMSDSTNTDEKTSIYNSHLKYQKQKLRAEIEVCANTRARARDSEICIDKNSNMEMKVCKKTKPHHDPCLGGINNKYKTPKKIPNKKEKICKPLNCIANLETNKTQKEVEWPSKLNCVATSCNNNESGQITKPNLLTSRQTCQKNSVKQNICGEKSKVNLKDNSLENTTKIIKKHKPKHYKIEENIKYSLEKGGQGKCAKCSKIKKKLCLSCLGGKFKKPLSRKKANKKRQSSDEALDTTAENLSLCKTLFQAADKLGIVSPHQSVSTNFVSKRTVLLFYEEKVDGKSSKNKKNESPKSSKQSYKKLKDGLNRVEEPNKVSEKLTQYQKCRKTEVSPAVSIKIKEETKTCPIMKASKRYRSKMRKRGLNLVPVSTGKKPSSVSYSTYSAHYTPLQFKEHDKHVTSQNNMEKSSLDRLNNERFKKDMTSLSDKLSEDVTSNSKFHEDYSEINTKQKTDTLNEEIRKCNISSLTTIKEVTRTNLIDKINGFGKIYYSNKSGSYTQIYDIPTYSNNKLISHSLILRQSYSKYKAGYLNVPEGGSLNQFRKITEPCLQISRRMKSTDSKGDSACRFKYESNSKKGKINSASDSNNRSTKVKGIIENDINVSSETSPCGKHLKSRGDAKKEGEFSDKGEVKKETFSSFFKIPSWCKSKPMKVETNTPQNGPPTTKTEIAKSPSDCGKTELSPLCGICGHKNANKISPGATKSSPVNTSDTEEVCSKIKSEKLSSVCVNNEASKKSEMFSEMLKSSISTPVCGGKETTKEETGGLKKDLSTSSLVCGKEDSRKLDPNILRTEPTCPPPHKMIAEKLCPRIHDSIPPPSCVDKSKSTCPKVSLNSSNCEDSNAKKFSEDEYSKAPLCANRSKSTCPKLEMSKCKDVKNNTELEKQTHPNIETFKHSVSNEIPNKSHTQKSKPVDTTASPTNEDKCHPKSHDAPDCKYPESPRVTCMTTRQAKQFSESKGDSSESTILCPPRKDPTPKAPVCKTHHKSLEKIIKQTELKDPPPCGDEGTASKGAKRLERPKYELRTPDKDKKEEKDFSARQWMEKYGQKLKKMGCPPVKPTVAEIPCEVAKKPQKFLQCKEGVVKEQPSKVNTGKEDSKKIVGEKTDMRDEKCEHDLAGQQCQWGDYKLPELGPDGEVIRADEKWPFQKKGPETEN
uniref:(California timema) hypothetical protein n=1 Tax=Timema californicum TaxID=61474 RepID=A0A7R9JEP4_TIMCA|nr:unnamed protein product [Timema californicum]